MTYNLINNFISVVCCWSSRVFLPYLRMEKGHCGAFEKKTWLILNPAISDSSTYDTSTRTYRHYENRRKHHFQFCPLCASWKHFCAKTRSVLFFTRRRLDAVGSDKMRFASQTRFWARFLRRSSDEIFWLMNLN